MHPGSESATYTKNSSKQYAECAKCRVCAYHLGAHHPGHLPPDVWWTVLYQLAVVQHAGVWQLGGRGEAAPPLLALAQQGDVVGRHLGQLRQAARLGNFKYVLSLGTETCTYHLAIYILWFHFIFKYRIVHIPLP